MTKELLVLGAFLLVAGFLLGIATANGYWRGSAIEAGVAKYTCDSTTGNLTFEWIEQPNIGVDHGKDN